MKANELQIGDYVYNHRNWACPIVEIHKNSAVVIARHYGEEEFLLSDLEPIPLTEKILQNNGFVKYNYVSDTPPYDEGEDGEKYYSFSREDKETFCGWWQKDNSFLIPANGLGWITFKYVHELQHALRLCRIEKEIIL